MRACNNHSNNVMSSQLCIAMQLEPSQHCVILQHQSEIFLYWSHCSKITNKNLIGNLGKFSIMFVYKNTEMHDN